MWVKIHRKDIKKSNRHIAQKTQSIQKAWLQNIGYTAVNNSVGKFRQGIFNDTEALDPEKPIEIDDAKLLRIHLREIQSALLAAGAAESRSAVFTA